MAEFNIIHNKQNMRFEILIDDQKAFLEDRMKGNDIAFMHTEVPESLSGKGIASVLAVYAFKYAKENNLPVIVYCPFVKTFLKRHPEYNVQLDHEFVSH